MSKSRILIIKLLCCGAVVIVVPFFARATELVNINTADKATLVTLNGIGDSKAQAIIDYRTQHGPFSAIEEIMQVSGIGTATYNNIKSSITVGSTQTQQQTTPPASPPSQTQAQSSQTTAQSGNGATIPSITVRASALSVVPVGGGSRFRAEAFGTEGQPLSGARFLWNFGDGSTAEGEEVLHTYAYPGTYVVSVTGAYNFSSGVARLNVMAAAARVSLVAVGDGSLLIQNESGEDLVVGLWSLQEGGTTYAIPEGTILLKNGGIQFAQAVTRLGGGPEATLRYPNGALVAKAVVGEDSPLRGVAVTAGVVRSAPVQARSASSPARENPASAEVSRGLSQTAAAAESIDVPTGSSGAFWGSFGALVALLGAGVWAVRSIQKMPLRSETATEADEFKIEEYESRS